MGRGSVFSRSTNKRIVTGCTLIVVLVMLFASYYSIVKAGTIDWADNNFTSISAGAAHTCAVTSGLAYCWGDNTNGQLGNNSTNESLVPVAVSTVGVLSGKTVTAISVGASHTCAVASGLAYCWGLNTNGRLGNNSQVQSLVPVAVTATGVLSGKTVTAIAAGNSHTCAVASSLAYCWGLNGNGQLGNNSITQSLVPVAVTATGVLSGKTVTAISAGTLHTCAVASSLAYCWGNNGNGQLGNNSITESRVPVAVTATGVLSGKTVTAISAGGSYACAVASSAAFCWGLNTNGRLGNNSTTQSLVPVAVDTSGVLSGKTVTAISAASSHSCTVASGAAYCWGGNPWGQLGDNSTNESLVPVAVSTTGVLFGKTVTAIDVGATHTCAIASSTAYCWGHNANGRLGNNSVDYSTVPVVLRLSAFFTHSSYRLFANADAIQPGSSLAAVDQPVALQSAGSPFRIRTGLLNELTLGSAAAIANGDSHSCAIASSAAFCWGSNTNGRLGNNSTATSPVPVVVNTSGVLSDKTVTAISAGFTHTCAVASGAAYCWGGNTNGQLGNNSTTESLVPVAVNTAGVLAGKTVTAISAGTSYTCAVASGAAYCWGYNFYGQFGDNSTTQSLVPVAVNVTGVLAGKTVTAISAGDVHSCAVASSAAYCWGANQGRLGNNSITQSLLPVATDTTGVLSGKTITGISAGNTSSCAVASGAAYCWGSNGTNGVLGNNSTTQSLVPVAVTATGVLSGKTVTGISASRNVHACAVASGAAYCWGSGASGRLGDNSTAISLVPVAVNTAGVLSGKTVTAISAGGSSGCVVATSALYCWGANTGGQLGNNSLTQSLVPVTVVAVFNVSIPVNSANLKLQYAQKTAATCSQQVTGFADVSATSAIAWYINPSVANGTAISSNVNDPTAPANTIYQSYVSGGVSFKNTLTIPVNKFSLWDFSLKDNSGLANTTYCMKIVYVENINLDIYRIYPEITTAPASFSLGFVDNAGAPVANPAFAMTATNRLATCQTVTGTIGSASGNRMRLAQGGAGNGWNISIAATNGATSSWIRTDNGAYYDFNDSSGSPAGCNSGSDGDGLAGQLSVAANSLTITPQSGCSTTGLSLGGGMTGFTQGTVDAITLVTSTSGSQSNCYWDLSDMSISQKIPSGQAQGSYELQLTATVVAQ